MKKHLSILLVIIIVVSFSACQGNNTEQGKSTYQNTQNEETTKNVTTEVFTEPTTEALIPSIDELNDAQKALLPYYNNGYNLTEGDRDLYYLGKLVANRIQVYVDNYSNNYLWTITDDKTVFFRGEVSYQADGKWLMTYDVKTGVTNKIKDWVNLEKYGDSIYFTSDGKNVFILFRASEWYNVVQVDKEGNDTLLSKIDFHNSFNSDEGYSEIDFLNTMRTENEYEFFIYGTINKYDSEQGVHKTYYRKYNIDFKTGKYECVDEIISPEHDGGFIFLPISMCFLPNNNYFYGKEIEVSDELTGYKHLEIEINEVDRNNNTKKVLSVLNYYSIDEAYLTDKYLIINESAIELSTGDVLERSTVNDSLY